MRLSSPFPPHYLPSVYWWAHAAQQAEVVVGLGVNYEKQTPLSRCHIYTASGLQQLCIPVVHASRHQPVAQATIDYRQRWQQVHARAIQSAYGRCAYWPYYGDELLDILYTRHDTLLALNLALIHRLAAWLQLPVRVVPDAPDPVPQYAMQPYYQPWGAWQSGLCGADLLLNCGPESRSLLIHAPLQA